MSEYERYAVVFPGQGAQHVGMLADFIESYPVVRETLDEASQVLSYDVTDMMLFDHAGQLSQTEYTQPIMLAADIALWNLLSSISDTQPNILAGHSLGEFAALVAAESLSFADALTLVANRGRYMQQAVPDGEGAMAAIIGLDNQTIDQCCDSLSSVGVVSAANYNSIGQTVIAGEFDAVHQALPILKSKGAKLAKIIPVSVPSHCILMEDAKHLLAEDLEKIVLSKPKIDVMNNVSALCYHEPEKIKQALLDQLVSPVRWVDIIQSIIKMGIDVLIESGPGVVLNGLNKRIDRNITQYSMSKDFDKIQQNFKG